MEFTLNADVSADEDDTETAAPAEGFSISSQPVVAEVEHADAADDLAALPRTYRTQTLWLMPRDPQSVFAFWDVDWQMAFGSPTPAQRKVHLRLMRANGSEEAMLEIEPMKGNCYVPVESPGESYTADLGFYETGGAWHSIATSASVDMPVSDLSAIGDSELATIPLHLDFQRMIDAFRVSHHESASLTDMIADARRRAADDTTNGVSAAEQEIVREINAVVAAASPGSVPEKSQKTAIDWRQIEQVIGFGNSSLSNGFTSSSRGW